MSFSTSTNTIFANCNMDPQLASTLVYCTVIIIAKMLVTNILSFVPNILSNNGPVEDRWMWKSLLGSSTNAKAAATNPPYQDWARRMNRVVGNDLENIPIALMALWLAAFTTILNKGTTAATAAASDELVQLLRLFVAARIAHSVTYVLGISGVRSVAYFAGLYPVVRALQLIWQSL